MDSNTINALSMVLNHESTDEVIRLRKENIELKSKLNRIESNMKRLTECISNCELIMEIVSERDDDVMNNVPFETMLDDSLREDNDFELSDDERRQLLIDYNNNKDLITIDNFDHGLEAPIMGQIMYPITRSLSSKPETFEYILKHINPIRQQYGSRRTFPLLPDFKMYVSLFDYTCEDGIKSICEEHGLALVPTFKDNQRNAIVVELENGLSHRIDMFLSKLKEWKLNDCIDELKPRLFNLIDTGKNIDKKEITIHDYVKYYLDIKNIAYTEHQYEFEPCRLFRDNLDEYLRDNQLT
jgi:hypothetical protein